MNTENYLLLKTGCIELKKKSVISFRTNSFVESGLKHLSEEANITQSQLLQVVIEQYLLKNLPAYFQS